MGNALSVKLEMEVGSGRITRPTDFSNFLTSNDFITSLDKVSFVMAVNRLKSISMINHDVIAKFTVSAHSFDGPIHRCINIGSGECGEINTLMTALIANPFLMPLESFTVAERIRGPHAELIVRVSTGQRRSTVSKVAFLF